MLIICILKLPFLLLRNQNTPIPYEKVIFFYFLSKKSFNYF